MINQDSSPNLNSNSNPNQNQNQNEDQNLTQNNFQTGSPLIWIAVQRRRHFCRRSVGTVRNPGLLAQDD